MSEPFVVEEQEIGLITLAERLGSGWREES